jgi:uncharacterized membrane protein
MMPESVLVLMRWLHIASAAALAGGLLYGWLVLWPAANALPADLRQGLMARAAARFRPLAFAAIPASLISGIYSLLANTGHTPRYHMVLGIKLLLALHVFAAAFILGTGKARNPSRTMAGAALSGLVIIAMAAYLRRIF